MKFLLKVSHSTLITPRQMRTGTSTVSRVNVSMLMLIEEIARKTVIRRGVQVEERFDFFKKAMAVDMSRKGRKAGRPGVG